MNVTKSGVRKPAVAGRFYPGSPPALRRSVEQVLLECNRYECSGDDAGRLRAVIAPHAGYVCSAIVAAASFRAMQPLPNEHYTVYIIGPAHWYPVHGIGLSSARTFRTPLGDVPVATEQVQRLAAADSQSHVVDEAHTPEHCLEVQLPFLQTVLSDFSIVPMLCDDDANPEQLADYLTPLLADDPHSLLVVSSDLSHYQTYQQANQLDRALLSAVVSGDRMLAAQGQACGITAILALMDIAQRLGWRAHLVNYRNSGDTCGSHDRVVGYGAVAFCEKRGSEGVDG